MAKEIINEIWKPIKGYEDRYMVSNIGRIKSLDIILHKENGVEEFRKGKIRKPTISCFGYYTIYLSNGSKNKRKMMPIHRLVANAFLLNPDRKPCVDHINTIRADNRVVNLRWVTYSENNRNPITMKKYRKKGEYHHTLETKLKIGIISKGRKVKDSTRIKLKLRGFPVMQISLDGNTIAIYPNSVNAREKTGICDGHIRDCCKNKRKTAGGFKWKQI